MNRTLIAVLSAVALVFTVPSFAAPENRSEQQIPSSSVAAGGGALEPLVPQQGAVPANEMTMTGQVVLANPDELVIHTSSGMQRFTLMSGTQMLDGVAPGETVTVFYKPETGSAKATVVKSPAKAQQSNVQPAAMTDSTTTTTTRPAVMGMNNPKLFVNEPMSTNEDNEVSSSTVSQTEKPATTSEPMTNEASMKPTRHLPKTASNLPLIGVTGLLALAGAVLVRAVRT